MSDDQSVAKAGRGLRIALVLSLAVNLLILGLIGGLAVGVGRWHPRGDDGPPPLRAMGLGPVAMALSREDREALRARIGENREDLRRSGAGMGRAALAFVAALRAEEFDREAAAAALAAQRENGMELQARGHEVLLDQLQSMEAGARAELADRIEHSLRRILSRGGDREGAPRP